MYISRTAVVLTLLLACPFLFDACAARKSYTILHLSGTRSISILRETSGRELLLDVDDHSKTFRLIGASRMGGGGLVVRTMSYLDGEVLHTAEVPMFSPYYTSNYVYGLGFAVSPSTRYVAYVDPASKSLIVFNTRDLSYTELRTNFCTSIAGPATFLTWVSDAELLAGADGGQPSQQFLGLYSLPERNWILEIHPIDLWRSQCALSPSKEHFAYCDKTAEGHHVLRILDLKPPRIASSVFAAVRQSVLACPGWSDDSQNLAYLEDRALMSFSLSSATSKALKLRPNHLLSTPISYTAQRLLCRIDPHDGFPKPPPAVYVLDLLSGEESVISNPNISGELLIADHGSTIIYGMGQ